MPSKNIIKLYSENGYYHLYNRGVEKRKIFLDKKDCIVFQRFLKQYLSPKEELSNFIDSNTKLQRLKDANMSEEIELHAFALMPNHFHLLLKQKEKYSIAKFMKRFFTSYVKYFNKKYNRVGPLFQDTYKGILVPSDEYLLHLSRYIHLNPVHLSLGEINFTEFNSFPYYLGEKQGLWLHPDFILGYFNGNLEQKKNSYKEFVEGKDKDNSLPVDNKILDSLLLDN